MPSLWTSIPIQTHALCLFPCPWWIRRPFRAVSDRQSFQALLCLLLMGNTLPWRKLR
jgi:hypothetical protein